MANRRLHLRPPKTPIFLTGEGASEQGYARWLNKLARELGIAVHVRAEGFTGGDALELVKNTAARLRRIDAGRRTYRIRGLLLDRDTTGANALRNARALRLAETNHIELLWQEPCHEGFLLRHFEGYQSHRPPDAATAERQLSNVWPDYRKGMDAIGYEAVLRADHLTRMRQAEAAFDMFLRRAGWP